MLIPCYNEEGAVLDTVRDLQEAFKEVTYTWELITIDDGSSDATLSELEKASDFCSQLRVVRHAKNRGYGASLKTGLRYATGELVAITDADGTYPVANLPDLVERAREHDMVVGARTGDNVSYPLIRKIPKVFLKAWAQWLTGQPIPDMNSGMRVFRREVGMKFWSLYPDGFSFTTTITMATLRRGYLVEFVPIDYAARIGSSKIQPIRDTLRFVQLIFRTGVTFAPLRVFMPMALLFALGTAVSFYFDFVRGNLAEGTLLLLMITMNISLFALLADMIDKRSA